MATGEFGQDCVSMDTGSITSVSMESCAIRVYCYYEIVTALDTRKHDGKVAVKESNTRWCSVGLELSCDNG